jgi:hypothetical protein
MNKLSIIAAAGLLALASEGCVVERGSTSTGGRYDNADAGFDDTSFGEVGVGNDTGRLDVGVQNDTGDNVTVECQNNYSDEIRRVFHGFTDRTNNANLLEITDISQPVLLFSDNYDYKSPYYIQPVTTETGHLIRGAVDTSSTSEQVAVGVVDFNNDSEDYTDRQFLEVAYNGQTPESARTYVEYGKVVAGTSYDLMVNIAQADDLNGACDVALQDGFNNTLDELVLCEDPCEALLETLSRRAISVINQD